MKVRIENPEMRRLMKRFRRLPEYLNAKRRKAQERQKFVARVFGDVYKDIFG